MPVLKYLDPISKLWLPVGVQVGQQPFAPAAGCVLRRSTAYLLPHNTAVKLGWDSESRDSHGFHDSGNPSRITIPAGLGGPYLIETHIVLSPAVTPGYEYGASVNFYLNGVLSADTGGTILDEVGVNFVNNLYVFDLVPGDYLEVEVTQTSSQNVNVYGHFSATLLAGVPGPRGPAGTVDYSEALWTPGFSFGGASVGMTYEAATRGGTYVKVGKLVIANFYLRLTAKGSSTGAARLTGLPFTPQTVSNVPAGTMQVTYLLQFVAGQYNVSGWVNSGVPTVDLYSDDGTGVSSVAMTNADFNNTTGLGGTVIYTAAA